MSAEHDVETGIRQMEGYLLWNSKVAEARAQAEAITRQLDWLTTAQREEVERAFVTERLAFHKAALERVAVRAEELRGEYQQRYTRLKARCIGWCAIGFGVTAGLFAYVANN
ncbi:MULTISPECIES: hypothetical protein [unclassified Streptomyces]|uniref:hypothetical protein n=1 Tax=unclassified Streptomyces TaxID=2593676 RepID=UPI000DB98692|nr:MULTISPECIES: hypothetical protein [unclassified Streptomyces]MYT75262.1 hypothetical protein [Streptomyces sp. SID8367]RAJ77218.1 hypothetical protein K377_05976 [Streptomyces sp. PsTaAH-137]